MLRPSLVILVSLTCAGALADPSPRCAALYPKNWQPVMGQDKQRPPAMPKPERGKPFLDPLYKTCVVRLTDHAADGINGFVRTDYSRRQAFNADDTKIIATALDGAWHLFDANTGRHLEKLPEMGGDIEPQWHPTNPNILYYLPMIGIGMQIRELNLATHKQRVLVDLAPRVKAIWPTAAAMWTKSEGSPSADARYWAFMVDDKDWKGLGLITYDLTADRILASYDYAQNHKERPDHVSMSPSGNYVVASWGDGTWSFTRDFKKALQVHRTSVHSDLAFDANGEDTYVAIDYDASGGPVYMTNLRTGMITFLFITYLQHTATNIHFSGKAFKRPGWVLMSTFDSPKKGPWQWEFEKIFAVELKKNPRIINLANHHAVYNEYFTEPHATVNRDFTRVLFNSNWDVNSKTDIDIYSIELPKNAIPAN